MSTHLLRTTPGGRTRFSAKFINNGATSATDIEFFTCEYDRMVYSMWERAGSPNQFHVSQFNIQSGVTTYLGYVTQAQLNTDKLPGGWLCDGKYMYFSFYSSALLVRVLLEDMITINSYTNSSNWTCWGRSQWYDDHTIALMNQRGIALFDTKTTTWSYISYKPSNTSGCQRFAITDKLIVDVSTNSGAQFCWYNRQMEEYHQTTLPTSTYACDMCYGDGKFYVVNQAYVFVFDEETETWEQEYTPVHFQGRPRYCVYAEGLVYIIIYGSARFWVYETHNKHVAYKMLPWNVPESNNQCVLTPYHRYVFIQCFSFGYLNYEGLYKYNAGYKCIQYVIPCAEGVIDYESKDPCLVVKPSYVTYEVNPDEIPFTYISQRSTIKSAPVNKNNYKTILSIKIK